MTVVYFSSPLLCLWQSKQTLESSVTYQAVLLPSCRLRLRPVGDSFGKRVQSGSQCRIGPLIEPWQQNLAAQLGFQTL